MIILDALRRGLAESSALYRYQVGAQNTLAALALTRHLNLEEAIQVARI